jgi:hypothetical protein
LLSTLSIFEGLLFDTLFSQIACRLILYWWMTSPSPRTKRERKRIGVVVAAAVGEAEEEEEEEAVAEAVVVAVGGEEGFRRKIAIEVLFVFFFLPDSATCIQT